MFDSILFWYYTEYMCSVSPVQAKVEAFLFYLYMPYA